MSNETPKADFLKPIEELTKNDQPIEIPEPDELPDEPEVSEDSPEEEEEVISETVYTGCTWEDDVENPVVESTGNEIAFPSELTAVLDGELRSKLEIALNDDDPASEHWKRVIRTGVRLNTTDERFVTTIGKGDWKIGLQTDNGIVGPHVKRMEKVQNKIVRGGDALARARQHIGGGDYYDIPLHHSGIWYALRPVEENDLLALYRHLTSAKINLGAYTFGSIYSAISAYNVEKIMSFILSHFSTCSFKYSTNINPFDHILLTDVSTMIWSLNCMIFQDGFNYSSACVADASKCQDVTTRKLNPRSLLRVNDEAVPTNARNFMASTRGKSNLVGEKQLKQYQDSIACTHKKDISLTLSNGGELKFSLRVPTINQYIESSHVWIDGLTNMIEEAVTRPTDDDQRNQFIRSSSLATSLRQYAHYIETLTFGDGLVVDNAKDIGDILATYTRDESIRTFFMDEIGKFIDQSTIAVTGIRNFDCPTCSASRAPREQKVLPLDQIELFFRVLGAKVREIESR